MKGNLIKGEMAVQGLTMRISVNSLSAKVNGRSAFNTDEVIKLCKILHITEPQRKVDIFLT